MTEPTYSGQTRVLDRYTEAVVTEVLSQRRTQASTSIPHITAAVEHAASKIQIEQTLADFETLRGVLAAEGPVPQYTSRRFMRLRMDWPELWEALRKISAILLVALAGCMDPTETAMDKPEPRPPVPPICMDCEAGDTLWNTTTSPYRAGKN